MNENDVLGFDPTQLTVFDETAPKSQGNPNIYYTRPSDSKSKDQVYRCTIKVIYNPFNLKNSVLEQQAYAMTDNNGFFSVVSSLTVNDTSCPIFKAWKKCHFAKQRDGSFKTDFDKVLWLQSASKDDDPNGKSLFDKRFTRYVTIQVISDKNQPDLEGKYMLWKMPKAIWEAINKKMNPSKETGRTPIPVMDFLFGHTIDLEVAPGADDPNDINYKRKTSYSCEISEDCVSCVNPDMSPILKDDEQEVLDNYIAAMKPIWKLKAASPDDVPEVEAKRAEMLKAVNADANTQKLRDIYNRVLVEIKNVCPDLFDTLGYHEWTDDVKQRVQNWIDIVLSGNDPAGNVPKAVAETPVSNTVKADAATTADIAAAPAEDDDDLPF